MPDFETDVPTVTTGFTGKVVRLIRLRRRKHVILIGRDDKGKPLVLTIRLAATHDPKQFKTGRKVRVAEVVGKMGRELMLAFPARKRAVA